ncbi:hypothetical protein [Herbiconiux solani]|uniref:hypothetical protein n=1 Tax=Herbiconiux solani TaxID=661329 RepID=UPI000826BB8F|nr:hypothetical protein [Herbiconiux solani]
MINEDDFDAILDEAGGEDSEHVDFDVMLGKTLITFRLLQMPGDEYNDLTATNPPRMGSRVDSGTGFNAHAASKKIAANYIRRVLRDGTVRELSEEQWQRALAKFKGRDLEMLATVFWGVNYYTPNERVKAAKKALLSEDSSGKNSDSPASSELPTAD